MSTRRTSTAASSVLTGLTVLMMATSTTAHAAPSCLSRSSISPDGMLRLFPTPLDRPISLNQLDISLRDALDRVAVAAKVRLTYSSDLLPRDRRVCLDVDKISAGIVLAELLRNTQLRPLAIDGDNVVLAPAGGPTVSQPAPPPERLNTVSQLEQIVVTGTAGGTKKRSSPFALEVIDGATLVRSDATSLAAALDGAVPGIWMWPQSPSSPVGRFGSVRGASSFGVTSPKIYIDGIEAANPLVLTQLDPERVDRVEVIRGPQGAALYGADAISGVVNIISRHDGSRAGQKLLTLSTRAGHSTSDYSSGTFVQDHSLGLRAGSGRRSLGLGATVGTVGDYIPGGAARSFLGDGDVRLVGSRTIFTGVARFAAKDAGSLASPLLLAVPTSSPPPLNTANNMGFSAQQGGGAQQMQAMVNSDSARNARLSTGYSTDSSQSLRQYTVGTTTTFMQNARWTHTLVAGADGYQMNGVATQGIPVRNRSDSLTPLAHSESDRTTLSFRSVARFGSDEGNQTTLTLGAEHSATRQELETHDELRGGELSVRAASLAEATSVWSNTAGALAQINTSLHNNLFLSAGGRAERTTGFSAPARVSLLPMLGAAYVKERDGQTLKLRASYGKGIRPATSALRSATWMSGQNSGLLSSAAGSRLLLSSLRNLEPEAQSGVEFGADLSFGRSLGFHVTRFDQRATGLIQAVALPTAARVGGQHPEQEIAYALQNVGAITNRGWELQTTSMLGRWSLVAGASFVDSRVQHVAQPYGGELRAGDRMLEVPARTFSLQAMYTSSRWTMSWTAARASDWINYDQLLLAEQRLIPGFDANMVTGRNLRNYWRAYDGATRLRGTVSYSFSRGFSLIAGGDNLLNLQRGEPDNVTVIPGRTPDIRSAYEILVQCIDRNYTILLRNPNRHYTRASRITIESVKLRVRRCAIFVAFGAVAAVSTVSAQSGATQRTPATMANPAAHATYVPNRVYDSRKKKWIDFETLVQRANEMELVFVGEQHDTDPVQSLELALLEGIARRRGITGGPVVVSMEMFERDAQADLSAYLNGTIDETSFLAGSHPWPKYATNYRPLVEIARANKWPVVAANVPRPLAGIVSRAGLKGLDTLGNDIRAQQVATEISCPDDQYAKLFKSWFSEAMNGAGHGVPARGPSVSEDSARKLSVSAAATEQRYYEAQCVKDETMGESVARALTDARARGTGALVVHVNGSFHTDYALGTADRAMRRVNGAKHMVIKIIPTLDIDGVDAKSMRKMADYLLFTVGKPE